MPNLDAKRLRRWADEMDAEERGERESALEEKVDKLEQRLSDQGLSAEDRELLTQARERLAALDAAAASNGDDPQGDGSDGTSSQGRGDGSHAGDEGGARRAKTRPGRKSGAAYDWTINDDGEVEQLDVAQVYGGEDEPERVELDDGE
jgi:hypothetical protein